MCGKSDGGYLAIAAVELLALSIVAEFDALVPAVGVDWRCRPFGESAGLMIVTDGGLRVRPAFR